jgi:hypothetical protein
MERGSDFQGNFLVIWKCILTEISNVIVFLSFFFLVIVLSVLLWFMDSNYPIVIFKLILQRCTVYMKSFSLSFENAYWLKFPMLFVNANWLRKLTNSSPRPSESVKTKGRFRWNYFYAFKLQFKCLGIKNIFFHNGYIVVWIIVITRYNWNIIKSGVKHHKPNQPTWIDQFARTDILPYKLTIY